MVFSHVIRGRPGGLFQFSGGEPSGSSGHMPKYGKMPQLDYRCKVRLLNYLSHLLIANKLVPFDSKQRSQAPLINSINPA